MRKLFIRICTIVLGATTLITLSGCMQNKEGTTPVTSSQESSAIADEVASADVSAMPNDNHKPLVDENDKEYFQDTSKWKVGENYPAGEYIIFSETPQQSAKVIVSMDENAEDVIFSKEFYNSCYIQVEDGQWLILQKGIVFPTDQSGAQQPIDGGYPQGMYKAGKDMPPGEYIVRPAEGAGKYRISGQWDSETAMNELLEETIVQINYGEYIELIGCTMYAK